MSYKIALDRIDEFEYEMIRSNQINHLIPVVKNIENDSISLEYNINEMKNINEYIEGNPMKESEIVEFLKGYFVLLESLDEYMLLPEHISLDLENIYVNDKGLQFMYIPSDKLYSRDLRELITLLLYKTKIIDDKRSLYPLFRYTSESASDNEIKSILNNLVLNTENVSGESTIEKYVSISDSFTNRQNQIKLSTTVPKKSEIVEEVKVVNKEEKPKKKGFFAKLFERKPKDKKNTKNEKSKKEKPAKIKKTSSSESKLSRFKSAKSQAKEISNAAVANTAPKEQEYFETTVLGENENSGKTNVSLIRLKTNEVYNLPENEEFSIGSSSNNSCVIKDNSAISRKHAKIIKVDGNYYVCDLNSTNGTSVEGIKIEKGGNSLIQSGNRIDLANEAFSFYIE